jgi:hypothetical protein
MTVPINPSFSISPEDATTLNAAYKQLLEYRAGMIAGLRSQDQSPYHCALIVDSLTTGLMSYFVEVARNQPAHQSEIDADGRSLAEYFSRMVNQINAILTQLNTQKPAPAAMPSQGRPPGKR